MSPASGSDEPVPVEVDGCARGHRLVSAGVCRRRLVYGRLFGSTVITTVSVSQQRLLVADLELERQGRRCPCAGSAP